MKTVIFALLGALIIGVGAYFAVQMYAPTSNSNGVVATDTNTEDPIIRRDTPEPGEATGTPGVVGEEKKFETTAVIGSSVDGRDIVAYHYGTGDRELVFVGGIHGGYEWNTVLVSYQLMDYLEANPDLIPADMTVTVIPVLNPDGLAKTVGTDGRFTVADVPTAADATVSGRFNAHNVDLNRNFDCDWQAQGVWQNKTVSGGTEAFSEPESKAFRTYIETHTPVGVVVYYSAAGGVYSSNCHNGVLPETKTLTSIYAQASGYPAHEEFNYYEITGDMVNWLAKEDIPAISVLLTTHDTTDWAKNEAGVRALLSHYGV